MIRNVVDLSCPDSGQTKVEHQAKSKYILFMIWFLTKAAAANANTIIRKFWQKHGGSFNNNIFEFAITRVAFAMSITHC